MKKIYINPTLEVVKITTSQMLAVSSNEYVIDPDNEKDGGEAVSRFFGDYDDEEE